VQLAKWLVLPPNADNMAAYELSTTLISDFSKGDKLAFAAIYNRYQRAVFANISKLIAQEQIVEDILHDVFIKLWENRHQLTDEKAVASWLFTVSYHQAVSYIRLVIKEKKYLSFVATQPVEAHLSGTELKAGKELKHNLIAGAIERLPAKKKQAFELCKLQGKTYAEASAIMGISPDTIKEHLQIAIQFVKSYARARYPDDAIGAVVMLGIYLQN
jgi:RNA polymerase sigma factor (sigma-70 family)